MTISLRTAVLVVALLTGCGIMHYYLPPAPMKSGEIGGSIGISWSTSHFASIALQANAYVGVTGRDVIGVGFNDLIVPSSFSYAHYIPTTAGDHANVQLHASIFGPDPRYEADLGYGMARKDLVHAFTIGVGYMGQPRLSEAIHASAYAPFVLLPVAGYDLHYKGLALGAVVQPGLSRHFAATVRERRGYVVDTSFVIHREQISSIARHTSDTLGFTPLLTELRVELKDGSVVMVINQSFSDVPLDCLFCTTMLHDLNFHTSSPDYRNYDVINGQADLKGKVHGRVMELNIEEIMRRYEETGVLVIAQEPDVARRALNRIVPGLSDLSLGAAYAAYGGRLK